MSWFHWFLVAWFLASALASIATSGKPRKPISPGEAAVITAIDLALVYGLLATGGVLS